MKQSVQTTHNILLPLRPSHVPLPQTFSVATLCHRRDELSRALGGSEETPLPPQNIFAVQNYHKGNSAQDPGAREQAELLFNHISYLRRAPCVP